uniref:uncharacterized protein LOC120332745 n=1 Tax=Styela clava TaxID=7725 RepID=UPI001939ED25|nr:uncharacterized protein LOC120332745 [Styela clava]
MPHPGLTLAQGLPYDKATVNDIDQKFVQQLTPLAESILHPDNLIVKQFSDGKPMDYRGLYATATKCVDAFGTIDIDIKVDDILEVIASAEDNEIRRACLNHYTKLMSQYIVGCGSEIEAKLKHNKAKADVISKFYSRSRGGADAKRVQSRFRLGLIFRLEDKPVPPTEFDTFHETCWEEAMGSMEKYGNFYSDLSSEDMKKEKARSYEIYKEQNCNRYEATIERLEMPGKLYGNVVASIAQMKSKRRVRIKIYLLQINRVVDQYEKKVNEIQEGGRVGNNLFREKRGSLLQISRSEFNSSHRKGNFRHYINIVGKSCAKSGICPNCAKQRASSKHETEKLCC